MISRRILRVKVMQVLYAHHLSEEKSALRLEQSLNAKIDKTKQLYFIYLQYLIEVAQYSLVDASKRANKFITSEEDLNVNTDISKNHILKLIFESDVFKEKQAKYSVKGFIDKKLVKSIFKKLQASEKYVKYCEKESRTAEDEIDILRYILKKAIGGSELLDEYLSEHFINLEDDHFITLHSLQKILKDYDLNNIDQFLKNILLELTDEEEIEFAKDLLLKYLSNTEEINNIIEPRLKNWEIDRVALIDVLLLKLAITEFLFFPYIPLKVSLNEYIDISKEYSSDKSKDFINGILDKVMKDLTKEGKIQKLGRGLINN